MRRLTFLDDFFIISVLITFSLSCFYGVKNLVGFNSIVVYRVFILFLIFLSSFLFFIIKRVFRNLERKEDIKIFLSVEINDDIKDCLKRLELDVLNKEENGFDIKKMMKLDEDDFSDAYYIFQYVE